MPQGRDLHAVHHRRGAYGERAHLPDLLAVREVYVTDRIALGLPAQVVVGSCRTAEELEEAYAQ